MDTIKAVFTYGKATIHLEGSATEIQTCLENGVISKHLISAVASADAAAANLDDATFEHALEHGWEWFSLHADHRMKSVNYFIVTVAFLTAAYVTALRFAHPLAALGICLVGAVLTLWFRHMELRIAELLKAGEAALKPLQQRLANRTGIDAFEILNVVEESKKPFTKYSKVIRKLHWTAWAMFGGGAILAIHYLYK